MLFLLLFPEVWDIISLRHNLTAMYGMVCVFCFGKNACPIFACHFVHWESCVAAIGAVFLSAQLRLRTFLCHEKGSKKGMFDNIGGKIKALAKVTCWVGIVSWVFIGIAIIAVSEILAPIGIIVAIVGPFLSWINSFLLLGFGQLVENSDIIAHQSQGHTKGKEPQGTESKKTYKGNRAKESAQLRDVPDIEYIDLQCPNCKETLSFPKTQLLQHETLTCPFCDSVFSV